MSLDIAENIRHHGFKRLLLAVSGGLDSICLAHYFICNKEAFRIEWLGIAHVHHGLREGTADRDAAFVEAFARKYNVPFFLKKLDGDALKSAEGSLEENARDARYKALVEITSSIINYQSSIINHPSSIIVTAHHAGDQAETMYMRLRRGTTLAGLRGIQALRQAHFGHAQCRQGPYQLENFSNLAQDDTSSIHIYRPLLNTTRAELLEYARENNLDWCEDESNSDVKFARNKIRHDFLPHLEDVCPGANAQLCRIAPLADKAYTKVIEKCNAMFQETLQNAPDDTTPTLFEHNKSLDPAPSNLTQLRQQIAKFRISTTPLRAPLRMTTLNKKKLRKVLLAHTDADLSEMFRLWLSELGFRFPIGFFYDPKKPAHVKIPVRAAYRKRSIAKKGHTVIFCEFESVESALKFVSCEMK